MNIRESLLLLPPSARFFTPTSFRIRSRFLSPAIQPLARLTATAPRRSRPRRAAAARRCAARPALGAAGRRPWAGTLAGAARRPARPMRALAQAPRMRRTRCEAVTM